MHLRPFPPSHTAGTNGSYEVKRTNAGGYGKHIKADSLHTLAGNILCFAARKSPLSRKQTRVTHLFLLLRPKELIKIDRDGKRRRISVGLLADATWRQSWLQCFHIGPQACEDDFHRRV